MSRWFFDDPEARERLKAIALECEGTPFRKFGLFPGSGGGFDCVGFLEYAMAKIGVVQPGDFEFARDDKDYSSANTMRRVIRYLRGQGRSPTGTHDPQSKNLAAIFAPVPIFRTLRARHSGPVNIDASLFMAGDILVLRSGGQFHLPLMIEGRRFLSAIPLHGVRAGNIHDTTYAFHIAALFRARAKSETLKN